MNSEHPSSAKKRRERRAGDTLRWLDSTFPVGVVEPGREGEEPDLVVQTESDRIGIEVVEYFTPLRAGSYPLKQRWAVAEQIARAATEKCMIDQVTEIVATVEFDEHTELRRKDVDSMATQIVALIEPVLRDGKSRYVRRRNILPRGVLSINANRRKGVPESFVGLAWGGVVPPVDEGELERLVRKKESKLSIYRRHCSVVWLLVIVDQYQAASRAYVPPGFRLDTSNFDRVVVIQGWTGLVDVWRVAV